MGINQDMSTICHNAIIEVIKKFQELKYTNKISAEAIFQQQEIFIKK